MPTAAVCMGAGLLELEPEPVESASLEDVPDEEPAELVSVLMLLLARPEALPLPVAWAPVAEPARDPPAAPVAVAPDTRLEILPPAPVAMAPASDVTSPTTLPASEVASPTTLLRSTAEVAPARALVTWLAMELRSSEAVSRGPLGSMADPTFERAAPRSWAYSNSISPHVLVVVACLGAFGYSGAYRDSGSEAEEDHGGTHLEG